MQNQLDIVRDVSQKLEQLQIPFMLTGSMALNYYAQPRMTRDIDVVLALVPEDIPRLVEAFEPEYYVSSEAAAAAVRDHTTFNLIHQESVIKVDCIVKKETEYGRTEFDRRQEIVVADFHTFVVSKEDLILSKLLWAKDSRSEMQLRDVKSLLATGSEHNYLESWAQRLGVTELLQECLHG
jgi:hypothetical protein